MTSPLASLRERLSRLETDYWAERKELCVCIQSLALCQDALNLAEAYRDILRYKYEINGIQLRNSDTEWVKEMRYQCADQEAQRQLNENQRLLTNKRKEKK